MELDNVSLTGLNIFRITKSILLNVRIYGNRT